MPTEPRAGTQTHRILTILKMRPICQSEIYRANGLTHRLAARIHDLRNMGWNINSSSCTTHRHDTPMAEYRLEHTDQMELPI